VILFSFIGLTFGLKRLAQRTLELYRAWCMWLT
jgi:hypothetical protein